MKTLKKDGGMDSVSFDAGLIDPLLFLLVFLHLVKQEVVGVTMAMFPVLLISAKSAFFKSLLRFF